MKSSTSSQFSKIKLLFKESATLLLSNCITGEFGCNTSFWLSGISEHSSSLISSKPLFILSCSCCSNSSCSNSSCSNSSCSNSSCSNSSLIKPNSSDKKEGVKSGCLFIRFNIVRRKRKSMYDDDHKMIQINNSIIN